MKSFSDVCKIIGISRKTLRGYNEIGLVHPVRSGAIPPENEKDLRPQYYTDEDVNKLMLAQIFAEAGYTRKEIKEKLDSKSDSDRVIEKTISDLKKKRERIDGFIHFLETVNASNIVADSTMQIIHKLFHPLYQEGDSSTFQLDKTIEILSGMPEEELQRMKQHLRFLMPLIAIAQLKDQEPGSDQVKEQVIEFCRTYLDGVEASIPESIRKEIEGYSNAKITAFLCNKAIELIFLSEYGLMISYYTEPGSIEFIIRAFHALGESYCTGDENFYELLKSTKSVSQYDR